MDILVDYQGAWGVGDLLCSDPLVTGLRERHGEAARIWLRGKSGNVAHNPFVAGAARSDQAFDQEIAVRLFTHMDPVAYGRLEAMDSLIDHMCSYADVAASDRRPRLWLQSDDRAIVPTLALPARPRIALCADWVDPLRHWPIERWQQVAAVLRAAGACVVAVGSQQRLHDVDVDCTQRLSLRQTAAVLEVCDLFVGNNSGLFHYAQAADTPCVTLFSLARPARFVHPGARVFPVQADGLPCLHCMTRGFASMQRTGCIAAPRGRCMTDIPLEHVLDAIDRALQQCGRRAGVVDGAAP